MMWSGMGGRSDGDAAFPKYDEVLASDEVGEGV